MADEPRMPLDDLVARIEDAIQSWLQDYPKDVTEPLTFGEVVATLISRRVGRTDAPER